MSRMARSSAGVPASSAAALATLPALSAWRTRWMVAGWPTPRSGLDDMHGRLFGGHVGAVEVGLRVVVLLGEATLHPIPALPGVGLATAHARVAVSGVLDEL